MGAGSLAGGVSMGGGSRKQESMWGGICGILTGILFVATFAVAYNFPAGPSQADATLAGFDSLRPSFLAAAVLIGLAAVFGIPFYSELRNAFAGKDDFLIGAATLFSIVGIVITAVGFIGEVIALDSLSLAYGAGGVSRTVAVVVAQAVIGFGNVVIFGFLVLVAGVGVYGYVTIRGRRFPRWLGAVGVLAAILSLVGTLPVSGTFVLFIVAFVLIFVWIFATSGYLWRSSIGAER